MLEKPWRAENRRDVRDLDWTGSTAARRQVAVIWIRRSSTLRVRSRQGHVLTLGRVCWRVFEQASRLSEQYHRLRKAIMDLASLRAQRKLNWLFSVPILRIGAWKNPPV